jgi:hypothetical protein
LAENHHGSIFLNNFFELTFKKNQHGTEATTNRPRLLPRTPDFV